MGLQRFSRPVEQHSCRDGRLAHGTGHLASGLAFAVEKPQGRPLIGREHSIGQRPQLVALFLIARLSIGREGLIHECQVDELLGIRSTSATQEIGRQPHSDRENPRTEPPSKIVAIDSLHDANHRLLDYVFGVDRLRQTFLQHMQ
jgi:hypothetical protein